MVNPSDMPILLIYHGYEGHIAFYKIVSICILSTKDNTRTENAARYATRMCVGGISYTTWAFPCTFPFFNSSFSVNSQTGECAFLNFTLWCTWRICGSSNQGDSRIFPERWDVCYRLCSVPFSIISYNDFFFGHNLTGYPQTR